MSTNIKLKRSAVQGKVPTTADLELGELAINTYDGKLYLKKDDGTEGIVDVTGGGATIPSLDAVTTVGSDTTNSITVGGLDVNGNITLIGTVDGRDVAADGTKLDGISVGAEVNQNAFSSVVVSGQPTITADTKTDTLTITAGAGIALSANSTTDTITISTTVGGGTVTSVGMTTPTGFVVSGSPITSSGTLALAYDTGYQGYTSTEATKLAGIEVGATADQSASEILAALITVDGAASGLDADILDGQHGSYYLDWTNVTNKPDPTITLAGDLSGSVTLTDLASGTLTASIVANSVVLGADTTGDYIATISGTIGEIEVSSVGSEGAAITIGLPNDVTVGGTLSVSNINVTGTVDGRDVSVDGTKLDGIETGATADQSASEILSLLLVVDGAASDLDADLLDGQHGSYYSDWTNVTNKPDPTITLAGDLTGSVTLTDLTSGTLTASIAANSVALGSDTTGNYVATISGTANEIEVTGSGAEGAGVTIGLPNDVTVSGALTVSSINVTGTVDGRDLSVDGAKLDGISSGAEVNQNAFSSIVVAGQTTIAADTKMDTLTIAAGTGISITTDANIDTLTITASTNGTVTSVGMTTPTGLVVSGSPITSSGTLALTYDTGYQGYTSTEASKLAGIESGATADQSAAEILAALTTVDGATSGLDADLLDGQHGSYYLDWTNTTNKPDPVITLAGDLSGSVTLTDLASGTLTASIVANAVELGTDTTGNYVATISGTANEIEVTGSGSETAAVTIGLPNSVTITTDLTVGRNLVVTGDFTVTGNTTIISANNLAITDNMIYLNEGSVITNPDLGITGNYNDGTYTHTGIFRDSTDNRWKFFKRYDPEPDSFIDTAHASYVAGDVQAATFYGDLSGNATTATTLQTSRTIGDVSFDGSANILPERINYKDTRVDNFTPYTYTGVSLHSKLNGIDNLDDGGSYHSVLNMQPWSDFTGGNSTQLGFTDNKNIYIRNAANSSSWSSWTKIYDQDDASSSVIASTLVLRDSAGSIAANNATLTTLTTSGDAIVSRAIITNANPTIAITETDRPTDNKSWYIQSTAGELAVRAATDAGATGGDNWRFIRSNEQITSFQGRSSGSPSITLSNVNRDIAFAGGSASVGTSDANYLVVNTNATERIRIASDGSVGIGTVSPSTLLHVAGEVTAVDFNTTSDRNVKENIEPIVNAISKVSAINGVTFNFIGDPETQRHAGVIAQDVEKVLPEAVQEMADGIKHVAYGNLIGLLIEAIKEQQKQIDDLKSIISYK